MAGRSGPGGRRAVVSGGAGRGAAASASPRAVARSRGGVPGREPGPAGGRAGPGLRRGPWGSCGPGTGAGVRRPPAPAGLCHLPAPQAGAFPLETGGCGGSWAAAAAAGAFPGQGELLPPLAPEAAVRAVKSRSPHRPRSPGCRPAVTLGGGAGACLGGRPRGAVLPAGFGCFAFGGRRRSRERRPGLRGGLCRSSLRRLMPLCCQVGGLDSLWRNGAVVASLYLPAGFNLLALLQVGRKKGGKVRTYGIPG